MQLELRAKTVRAIRQKMAEGGYKTVDDMLLAALYQLADAERYGDFEPGELARLVEEGEESLRREGEIPAEEVFAELRRRSQRLRAKSKSKSRGK